MDVSFPKRNVHRQKIIKLRKILKTYRVAEFRKVMLKWKGLCLKRFDLIEMREDRIKDVHT